MFGLGVGTFLLSKEYYIIEHEFFTGASLAVILIYGTIKMGPQMASYLDSEIDKQEADLQANRNAEITGYQEGIEAAKKEIWRTEAQALINEAKRENVKLQLEAEYRARLANVYSEVRYNFQQSFY